MNVGAIGQQVGPCITCKNWNCALAYRGAHLISQLYAFVIARSPTPAQVAQPRPTARDWTEARDVLARAYRDAHPIAAEAKNRANSDNIRRNLMRRPDGPSLSRARCLIASARSASNRNAGTFIPWADFDASKTKTLALDKLRAYRERFSGGAVRNHDPKLVPVSKRVLQVSSG